MDKLYITVGELAEHLNCPMIGDKNKKIFSIALYQDSNDDSLIYVLYNKTNVINDIKVGAIITRVSIGLPLYRSYMVTRHDPHEVLADTIDFMIAKSLYCMENHNKPIISDSTIIADNVFILPCFIDEYQRYEYYQNTLKNMYNSVEHYTVSLTSKCNARCIYCYEEGIHQFDMCVETADRLAEVLCAFEK